MTNSLFTCVSRESAGLWIAAAFAAIGLLLASVLPLSLRPPVITLALSIGTVLAAGAVRHLIAVARVRSAHPAPGRMIDIGGYRLHLLAEGEARGGPAIVWLPGAHSTAFALHHLHRELRGDTRSILLDRPGTGWSDVGPFPRSTAREADEIVLALERAGEPGPFVFAGHSFGGLLAANIARRRPDLVHTLVLLDPTPLDVIVFGPTLSGLKQIRIDALKAGWAALFGIDIANAGDRRSRRDPAMAKLLDEIELRLGPQAIAARAVERVGAGSKFAGASIYAELNSRGLAAGAWETVVYDGDLGDLPVLLLAPKGGTEIGSLPEAANAGQPERQRMVNFFDRTRERYLAISTRSRRIVAPAGSGHNFPFEAPEFVVGVMRELLERREAPAAEAETST